MMGDIAGIFPDLVMQTEDNVLHYGVYVVWGRNEAFEGFHALCDWEAQFPNTNEGLINMELLRESGVRWSSTARIGSPTCMACMATDQRLWTPPNGIDVG